MSDREFPKIVAGTSSFGLPVTLPSSSIAIPRSAQTEQARFLVPIRPPAPPKPQRRRRSLGRRRRQFLEG
jgi:hypothetical protein